jgi:hypothetical protein
VRAPQYQACSGQASCSFTWTRLVSRSAHRSFRRPHREPSYRAGSTDSRRRSRRGWPLTVIVNTNAAFERPTCGTVVCRPGDFPKRPATGSRSPDLAQEREAPQRPRCRRMHRAMSHPLRRVTRLSRVTRLRGRPGGGGRILCAAVLVVRSPSANRVGRAAGLGRAGPTVRHTKRPTEPESTAFRPCGRTSPWSLAAAAARPAR